MTPPVRSRLSAEFFHLKHICKDKKILLGNLFDSLSERSHALPILVFALPFFLPIPMPGLSVLIGIVLMTASFSMALGKRPWYPKRWAHKELSTQTLNKIWDQGIKVSGWLEKITVPSAVVIIKVPQLVVRLAAVAIFVCSFLLALPLPPGTNFPPALAIFFLALGILEGNAMLLTLGFMFFGLNLFIFSELYLVAVKSFRHMLDLYLNRYSP